MKNFKRWYALLEKHAPGYIDPFDETIDGDVVKLRMLPQGALKVTNSLGDAQYYFEGREIYREGPLTWTVGRSGIFNSLRQAVEFLKNR